MGRPSPIIDQPQCHVWIRDSLPAIQHNFLCNSKLKYLNTHTHQTDAHTHTYSYKMHKHSVEKNKSDKSVLALLHTHTPRSRTHTCSGEISVKAVNRAGVFWACKVESCSAASLTAHSHTTASFIHPFIKLHFCLLYFFFYLRQWLKKNPKHLNMDLQVSVKCQSKKK